MSSCWLITRLLHDPIPNRTSCQRRPPPGRPALTLTRAFAARLPLRLVPHELNLGEISLWLRLRPALAEPLQDTASARRRRAVGARAVGRRAAGLSAALLRPALLASARRRRRLSSGALRRSAHQRPGCCWRRCRAVVRRRGGVRIATAQ